MSTNQQEDRRRDQKSLEAARDGTGVTARFAILRLLDRKPDDVLRSPWRWVFNTTVVAMILAAPHADTVGEQIQALIGR